MRLRHLRDVGATLLVAAAMVPYVGYLARGSVPFVENVPAMAGAGIVLGLFAFVLGSDPASYGNGRYLPSAALGGVATLALGLAAFVTENAGVLAAFMCAIALMWLMATLHHLRMRGDHRPS